MDNQFSRKWPTTFVGTRTIWGGRQPFGFEHADRRHHLYCIGKTGTGKSSLLFNLLLQDMRAGHGVGLIDPHGSLAEAMLDTVPSDRTEDVVYFDPADPDYSVGFNLLQNIGDEHRHRVASGLVRAFKAAWHESWGVRLEYILYASFAALLECSNTSILGLPRMLVDRRYRRWIVEQVSDPIVRAFWITEYENYDERFRKEAIAPLQNKVGQLLMSPPVRRVLGQVKRKVDPRFMMDNRRIFIANLAKGRLGDDKANLLGAILTTSFELAAMQRVDVQETARPDFFLYLDEFQNFSTESFASILSEARKYHLSLTLSHQYTAQLPDRLRQAVFGNAGSIISFRVGESDAKILADEYGSGYTASTFSSLGNYEIVVKMLCGGQYGEPFKGRTYPPFRFHAGRSETVVRRSREKYSIRRHVVEEKFDRWIGTRRDR